jgi:hypothetical protein
MNTTIIIVLLDCRLSRYRAIISYDSFVLKLLMLGETDALEGNTDYNWKGPSATAGPCVLMLVLISMLMLMLMLAC